MEVGARGEAMSTLVKGTHHITYCPAHAQEDVDFLIGVLGQRLVKQTVLMDGRIPIHHLYYGNADADTGSITTSFPYSRRAGRPGSGQISALPSRPKRADFVALAVVSALSVLAFYIENFTVLSTAS